MSSQQQKSDWTEKRLNIQSCALGYTAPEGKFKIYNIEALNEEGARINYKLSAFDELPLGVHDCEVQAYPKGTRPGDGQFKNFTVRFKGGKRALEVAELKLKVTELESRIVQLEAVVLSGG